MAHPREPGAGRLEEQGLRVQCFRDQSGLYKEKSSMLQPLHEGSTEIDIFREDTQAQVMSISANVELLLMELRPELGGLESPTSGARFMAIQS